MFTNIDDALKWIMNRRNNNYSFSHFKEVCEKLGNIQDQLKVIHVAGSDGKGSTVNYLSDLLMSQGFKVGSFTSPHYITLSLVFKLFRDSSNISSKFSVSFTLDVVFSLIVSSTSFIILAGVEAPAVTPICLAERTLL